MPKGKYKRYATCENCSREFVKTKKTNWRKVRFCPDCRRRDPEDSGDASGVFLTHAGFFRAVDDQPHFYPDEV